MSESNSYRQILRSSSIMGSAQAISYLVGLVRVKIVALILGPAGVGLVGIYTSAVAMVGSVSSLGIGSSGVREVSAADTRGDPVHVARTIRILRRASWATGLLGWLVTAALAVKLSQWVAGSPMHALPIAILGSTLLLGAVSGGQLALLQGLRRIGDIARVSVWGVVLNSALAIGLYAWLGKDGIVPVLIASAAVTLALSYVFARRITLPDVQLTWRDTVFGAVPLVRLGVAFMWSAVLAAALDLYVRSLINRHLGLDATGIYQAAWGLSGMFAAFVLQAMGADFYPRLTSVINDHAQARQAVNEQTEIGILLAVPGLLATLAFAPLAIAFFYSRAFAPAADVLVWMVIGVFGRVVSWPMGFIMLALGSGRWFVATESIFIAIQAALLYWLVPEFGVVGAGYAFALNYLLCTVGMLWVGHRLIGFRWSGEVVRLLAGTTALVAAGLASTLLVPTPWRWFVGAGICMAGTLISARGLARRLGPEHRISSVLARIPGWRWIVGA